MRFVVILALALFAVPLGASAEGCEGAKDAVSVVQHIFDQADRDQDGILTQTEYEQAGLQHYGVTFQQSDLDGDGRTSLEEYLALYESHHPAGDETEV